jgi:hypothetical protein
MAWLGVARMGTGTFLVAFAFLESLGNLFWTLAFWTLALAAMLLLVFAWFPPLAATVSSIGRQWLQVWAASWAASLVYGLFMFLVFTVASRGSAALTLFMGLIGCFVALVFTILAGWTLGRALMGVTVAATGGLLSHGHLRTAQHMTRPVGQAGREALRSAGRGAQGLQDAGMTYNATKGVSRIYGMTTVAAPVLGRGAALAKIMGGKLPRDMEQAIRTSQGAGKEPLSQRAMDAYARDERKLYPERGRQPQQPSPPAPQQPRPRPPRPPGVPRRTPAPASPSATRRLNPRPTTNTTRRLTRRNP